jgi:hypothetical protein
MTPAVQTLIAVVGVLLTIIGTLVLFLLSGLRGDLRRLFERQEQDRADRLKAHGQLVERIARLEGPGAQVARP